MKSNWAQTGWAAVAVAAAGLLLALSFPSPALFPLAWFGLVPYLYFLTGRRPLLQVLVGNFLFGLLFYGGVLVWIPRVLIDYGNAVPITAYGLLALLALAMSFYLLPFSIPVAWIARRSLLASLLVAPGLWVLTEHLRRVAAASGFPWAHLGYSQYPFHHFIQLADVGGVELLSFLLVAANCSLLAALRFRRAGLALIAVGIPLIGVLYGFARLASGFDNSGGTLRVGVVQPSSEIFRDRDYYNEIYFRRLPERYLELVNQGVDGVIFPEMPNPFRLERSGAFRTVWLELVRARGVPLMLNGTGMNAASDELNNSTFLITREGITWRYNKQRLVPFGEYVPWGGALLGFVEGMVGEVAYFTPGAVSEPGLLEGRHFGVLICYESIFPELSRNWAISGAEFLVNVTNDAWFGRTAAPEQHLQMAVFRAIEQRRPIVRVANSGFTTLVDVRGVPGPRLGLFEVGTKVMEVTAYSGRTIYSWIQPAVVPSLILVSLCLAWMQQKRDWPRE